MTKKSTTKNTVPDLFADAEPDPVAIHPTPVGFPETWSAKLGTQFSLPYFAKLEAIVDEQRNTQVVFPSTEETFNAYRFTPPDAVKVVLLGQDPYPTPGHAHGLCFSVKPGVAIPASLRNISKELDADLQIPPAKHGFLASWAEQGVFMLNSVLTVRSGKPASHAKRGWETFTDATLEAINAGPSAVVFVLWGAYAQKKTALIDSTRHRVIASAHPSPLSASNGFFGSRPFSKINDSLKELGHAPIDWRLPPSV